MIELNGVEIETTNTGKASVIGAEAFAKNLKALKPHWFADKTAPNVNGGSPRVADSGGRITVDDLMAAEKEAQKSQNFAAYKALHAKYQAQPRS